MFGTYVSILRRRLLLMVVVGLVAAAAAYAALTSGSDVYRSEAVVRVGTQDISDVVLGRVGSYEEPDRRVANELEVMASPAVLDAAAELARAAGADLDRGDIAERVSFEQRAFSDAVAVQAVAGDPALAQVIVASVVEAYLEHRRAYQRADLEGIRDDLLARAAAVQEEIAEIDRQIAAAPDGSAAATTASAAREAAVLRYQAIADSIETVSLPLAGDLSAVEVVSPAGLPEAPEPEATTRAAILAVAAGLLMAGAAALLMEVLRNPVRTKEEAELVATAPVLATVPRPRGGVTRWTEELRSDGATRSASRALRFTLDGIAGGSFPRSVMVTSAADDEDQALFSAMALAASCGSAGMRTLLVADLTPAFDGVRAGGPPAGPFGDGRHAADAAEPTALEGVRWLPVTSTAAHVGVLESAPSLPDTLRQLEAAYDVVVVVTPPAAETAEVVAIARTVGAVVVACAVGRTRGKRLERLVGMLQRGGARVTGLVLTTQARGRSRLTAPALTPGQRTREPASR